MVKLPNVLPVQNSGLQSLAGTGIRIAGPEFVNMQSPLLISGRFIVTKDEFEQRGGSPHRDLVLTVLQGSTFGSFHPLKECLLFPDDVQGVSDKCGGWFNLNVFMYMPPVKGTYYVRVSLGDALSAVVKTKVDGSSTA